MFLSVQGNVKKKKLIETYSFREQGHNHLGREHGKQVDRHGTRDVVGILNPDF